MKQLSLTLSRAVAGRLNHLKRKYLERPKLEIQVLHSRKSYVRRKWQRNVAQPGQPPAYVYETSLAFRIVIRNKSDFDAYYPKLRFDRVLPHETRLDILNHYVPILAGGIVILHGEYKVLVTLSETQEVLFNSMPQEFKALNVLLSYENGTQNVFYTGFALASQNNTFYRFRPSDF